MKTNLIVAALYIDPSGYYTRMLGVDCWDEQRDAKRYRGPHPVVAHPPCGPWGKLSHMCYKRDPACGPAAVKVVRKFGGVLEALGCMRDAATWSASGQVRWIDHSA